MDTLLRKAIAILSVGLLAMQAVAAVRVTNFKSEPRFPWNGIVDIEYYLECDTPNARMSVEFQAYDKDKDELLPVTSITGDGLDGTWLPEGGPYKATWDSARDYPDGHSSALAMQATATVRDIAGTTYCVVDLTTGTHRYTDATPDLDDDTCRTTELWLRKIPAGSFMMGSPDDELGRSDNETLHKVTITNYFYIGVFEMTCYQYDLVMGKKLTETDTRPVSGFATHSSSYFSKLTGMGYWVGDENDIGRVSQSSFFGKLNELTNLTFYLPSEAQWEYACRAGTTTALNTGVNLSSAERKCPEMDMAGKYVGNGGSSERSVKVGSYLPNAWGLYDMHGNVSELCLDAYTRDLGTEEVIDPNTHQVLGGSNVFRGGGNQSSARECRSASRSGGGAYTYEDGFRVVLLSREL